MVYSVFCLYTVGGGEVEARGGVDKLFGFNSSPAADYLFSWFLISASFQVRIETNFVFELPNRLKVHCQNLFLGFWTVSLVANEDYVR